MTGPSPEAFARLARSARGDVWTPRVVRTLSSMLGADVLLADTRGSVLAAAPLRSSIDPMQLLAAATGRNPALAVAPVEVAGETVAIVGCPAPRAGAELLAFAASLIAADLLAHLKVLKARDEEAAAAFRRALHAAAPDPVIADELRGAGLEVASPFRILVGAVAASEKRLAATAWNLHALLAGDNVVPSRMTVEGCLVTLVPDGAAVPQRAKRLRDQLRLLDPDGSVGVSRSHVGVSGLRMGHTEAVGAAGLGPGVHEAQALDVVTTILLRQTAPDAVSAAASLLAPLAAYDEAHGGSLVATVSAWLANDRSAEATAEALFIHRNTLRYRLSQAEQLVGLRLDDTAAIVNLSLALRVKPT
jgi:purine catabolism regulator